MAFPSFHFQYHTLLPTTRLPMRPNSPTNNLSNVPIRIEKIHASTSPFPLHRAMDVHTTLVEMVLPMKNVLPLFNRKCIVQFQRNFWVVV
jgi:hypothetical protein